MVFQISVVFNQRRLIIVSSVLLLFTPPVWSAVLFFWPLLVSTVLGVLAVVSFNGKSYGASLHEERMEERIPDVTASISSDAHSEEITDVLMVRGEEVGWLEWLHNEDLEKCRTQRRLHAIDGTWELGEEKTVLHANVSVADEDLLKDQVENARLADVNALSTSKSDIHMSTELNEDPNAGEKYISVSSVKGTRDDTILKEDSSNAERSDNTLTAESVLVINALTMESLKTSSICCDGSAASTITCRSSTDLQVLSEEKLDNVHGKSIVTCQSSADFNVLSEEEVKHVQEKTFDSVVCIETDSVCTYGGAIQVPGLTMLHDSTSCKIDEKLTVTAHSGSEVVMDSTYHSIESLERSSICCNGSTASTATCQRSSDLRAISEEKLSDVQRKSLDLVVHNESGFVFTDKDAIQVCALTMQCDGKLCKIDEGSTAAALSGPEVVMDSTNESPTANEESRGYAMMLQPRKTVVVGDASEILSAKKGSISSTLESEVLLMNKGDWICGENVEDLIAGKMSHFNKMEGVRENDGGLKWDVSDEEENTSSLRFSFFHNDMTAI
ncbi:hypothetical protein KP509_21G086400 [Ceratopteris richardii]|nr:hypothetical protein KP509_21G086400 [Ceratopteris richardii]